jgi:hypothetical protein
MSLQALDPSISKAAQSIQGMSPDKALEYLEAHGLPLSTAVAILQNSTLKQHAAQQQQMQGAQAQQPSVKDKLEQQVKEAADQHAANEARQGGIADLPVPSTMFGNPGASQTVGMARGGIVAFSGEQDSLVNSAVQGQNYIPTTADINYSLPDVLTDEQKSQLLQQQVNLEQRLAAHAATGANFTTLPGHSFPSLVGNTAKLNSELANVNARLQNAVPTYENQMYASKLLSGPYTSKNTASVLPVTPAGTTPTSSNYDAQRQAEDVLGISHAATDNRVLHDTLHRVATKLTDKKTASAALNTKGTPSVAPIDPDNPDSTYANIFVGGDPTKIYQQLISNTEKEIKNYDPGNREDFIKNRIATTNEENKPTQDYLQWLQNQKDNLSQRTGQNKWFALSQAGFAMANAATKNPHGGFLGALAAGGEEGGQSYIKGLSDIRQAETDLVKSQYAARQHLVDGADAAYEKEATKALDAKIRLQGFYTKFADTQLTNEREKEKEAAESRRTQIMAAATVAGRFQPFNNLVFEELKHNYPTLPTEEILRKMPAYLTTELNTKSREQIAAGRSIDELIKNPVYPGMPGYDAYNAELAAAQERERGGAPAPATYQEGMTATGPNGQKIVYRNGQWVPA